MLFSPQCISLLLWLLKEATEEKEVQIWKVHSYLCVVKCNLKIVQPYCQTGIEHLNYVP